MDNLALVSTHLAKGIRDLGFLILSDNDSCCTRGVPLVAFRFADDDDRLFDEFALSAVLRRRGWVVPAYTMAPNSSRMKLMRVVVREDFTEHRCLLLLQDIKTALAWLDDMDDVTIKRYTRWVNSLCLSPFHACMLACLLACLLACFFPVYMPR